MRPRTDLDVPSREAGNPEPAGTVSVAASTRRPNRAIRSANTRAFLAAIAAGMLISIFGFGTVRVNGTSMQPALHDGDRALVLRLDAWLHRAGIGSYQPGDIVYFPDPSVQPPAWRLWLGRHLLIKRIAAGPGDRVGLHDGTLIVNGEVRPEHYLDGAYRGRSTVPDIVLPQGQVYVLGDNRAPLASLDSRSFGGVAGASIDGRAVLVFWPLFRRTTTGWRWNPHWLGNYAEPLSPRRRASRGGTRASRGRAPRSGRSAIEA